MKLCQVHLEDEFFIPLPLKKKEQKLKKDISLLRIFRHCLIDFVNKSSVNIIRNVRNMETQRTVENYIRKC